MLSIKLKGSIYYYCNFFIFSYCVINLAYIYYSSIYLKNMHLTSFKHVLKLYTLRLDFKNSLRLSASSAFNNTRLHKIYSCS